MANKEIIGIPVEDSKAQGLTEEEILKNQFRLVFGTPDGREVLSHILNMCGYFATDPKYIIPEKISIANQILLAMGITTPEKNLDYMNAITNV